MSVECSKCKAILDHIAQVKANPPAGINFGGERPLDKILDDIKEIIEKPTPLEQAAKKAATTGNREDLRKYLKIRRSNL